MKRLFDLIVGACAGVVLLVPLVLVAVAVRLTSKGPALFNQHDLIELRTKAGVHALVPGLTGWAQINGLNELPIPEKVALDIEYLHR